MFPNTETNVEQPQQDSNTSPEVSENNSSSSNQAIQEMLELDKHQSFKWKGQEWKLDDLEKSILLHKDYTKKTQSLSSERKALEEEKKYQENLAFDLWALKEDPSLLNKFIQTYPQKYHEYAKYAIEGSSQNSNPQQQNKPQPDIDLMSRLQKLESATQQQEVAKQEQEINSQLEKFSKKYPDAIQEMVLGRIYEAHSQGAKLTEDVWEDAFKQVDNQIKNLVKARYGEMVKKQTESNKKARDVESGGGTVGQAPRKVSSFREATNLAIQDLTGKHN